MSWWDLKMEKNVNLVSWIEDQRGFLTEEMLQMSVEHRLNNNNPLMRIHTYQ